MPSFPEILNISQSLVDFGNVNQSSSSGTVTVRFTAGGTSGINPNAVFSINPVDTRFTATPDGAFNLTPGTFQDIVFQFNATTMLGSVTTNYLTFGPGQLNPPTTPQLTATTVAGGSASWSVSPSSINFGTNKIGATVGPVTVTVTNNSNSVSLVINSITAVPTEFSLSGVPSLPATIAPLGNITFQVSCESEFVGFNDYPIGVTITPSTGSAQRVELMYTGFAINPAYTLTGATKGVLFGLTGVWDTGPSYSIQQAVSSMAPEVGYGWTKQFDFDNTSSNSYLNKVFLRTEPSGACTATLTDTTVLSKSVITQSATAVQTGAQDSSGVVNWMQFDLENNGESHKLMFNVDAGGGIVIINQLVIAYEPRGVVYESK